MKVIAYVRVSTDEQRLGPDAQRASIQSWASTKGLVVSEWHEDLGISGGADLEHRPGLAMAMDGIGNGDILVVAKLDRLARDVLLSAMIERLVQRAGGAIVSADGVGNEATPEGQLMRSMVAAFAQYERQIIKARTKAALAAKSARGERVGSIPYGYTVAEDGKTLIDNPVEKTVVVRIRSLRAAGVSLRKIGAKLLEEGLTPRKGGQWRPNTILDLAGHGC